MALSNWTNKLKTGVKSVVSNFNALLNSDEPTNSQNIERNENIKFCFSCGNKLNANDSFCSSCGAQQTVVSQNQQENRKAVYAGTIYKCPSCGAVVGQSIAICPDCGYVVTDRSAVSSVKDFSNQLMELEQNRKPRGFFDTYRADPIDTAKLTLIQCFPIPNTIEDVTEFVLLAIANIDVSLSKKTLGNKWNSTNEAEPNATQRKISNAWVSKLEQAYQKAIIICSDESKLSNIKSLYFNKLKELNIKQ